MISANIRGERTMKLMVAASEAYRFGYRISCQQVSSRHALVHADQVDPELLRLLEDREGYLRVVHPPRVRLAVVVAHVVELERLRAELADLPLHQVERLAALERVDRAPEDGPVGVTAGQVRALLPRGQAVLEQVGQRQRHGHEHVGVGLLVDHLADVLHRPLAQELLGRQLRQVVRGQRVVERVQVVVEHEAGRAERVLRVEVEDVRDAVENKRVIDHR
jgi:hypothetical protein